MVLRNTTGEIHVDTVAILDVGESTFVDAGLEPGPYEYRVSVVNQAGYVAASLPRSVLLGNTIGGRWSASPDFGIHSDRLGIEFFSDGALAIDMRREFVGGEVFVSHHEGAWSIDGSLLILDYHVGLYETTINDGQLRFTKVDRWDESQSLWHPSMQASDGGADSWTQSGTNSDGKDTPVPI